MKTPFTLKLMLASLLLMMGASWAQAQEIIVRGTVSDANQEPLIGAAVQLQGDQSRAVVTDYDGNYEIKVPTQGTLLFSYVGYVEQTVPINGKQFINVTLKENQTQLEDLVVIGYGTQKKADLTGSVAVVDMKEASKNPVADIASLLQGQVPGVSVSTSSNPGAMASVKIRGIGSFSNVGPLYVIDGLIVNDVNHLNPSEIESMQVLKDASAAAIYGARGANGVILITTKKGEAGKPTLDVTANFSISDMPKKIKMKSAEEFLYYNEQAYLNAGAAWPAAGIDPGTLPDTDWQDATYRTGYTQDYNIMYRQGSERTNMAIGAGYYNQTGVIEGPKYERYTVRFNSDATYRAFKIGENFTYQHTDTKDYNGGSFLNSLTMPPVIPVYDPDEPSGKGGFGYGSSDFPTYSTNPVANQKSVDSRSVNDRIIGNIYAELTLFKHLTYKLNVGLDSWWGRNKTINNCYTMRMASGEQRYDNVLTDTRDSRATLIVENTLTWNQTIGKNSFTVLAGYTMEDVHWHYLSAQGYNQKVDGLWQIDLVGTQNNMWGSQQERRMTSWLGRIDYSYDSRYLAQVNFRSDGCSKFGPDHRRGYFPSFSLGWRVSQEAFWESLRDVINNLKFRGSWGKIGDMQALGNYDYIPDIDHDGPYEGFYAIFGPSGNETLHAGATQSSRVNVDLGWETKTTTNRGVDFELFHSHLFGSVDYFNSKSTDLLFNIRTAWATGTSTMWTNYGKIRNRGIEVVVGWRDNVGDFNYSITANLSTVRNKVLSLGDSYYEAGSNGSNRTELGRSIGDFYLIPFDGIFQSQDEVFAHTTTLADGTVQVIQPDAQPGDVRYVDTNGDGVIDANDRVYCGSPLPKFEAGLNVTLSWKGWDFNMLWSGRYGNKIYNAVRQSMLNFTVDNIPADVYPWTWDNPSDTYPRMYANSTDNNLTYCDRFLEDGSFARLKNLMLGYTLPQSLTQKFFVEKLRLYVSGQNLLTITKYKGYDPDITCSDVFGQGVDSGQFPNARQFTCGLQVTF
ncbi:MAG: TonB-dependent receptor [Bacteroidales bacterium]|nr:TonB-dependent receptor [Bacteroidales bacterium]